MYNVWGQGNVVVASIAMPASKTAGALKGGIRAQSWTTLVKETGKIGIGVITDKSAGIAIDKVADITGMNETQKAGLKSAYDVLSVSKDVYEYRKACETPLGTMSYKDAQEYNGHWEKITREEISHPEMTSEDYSRWTLGNDKLTEIKAINKIDADKLIKLRVENKNRVLPEAGGTAGGKTSYGKSREIIQCSDINSKEVAKVEEKVPVSDAVMKSLEGSGLTSDRIKEIRDLPKPDYSKGEFVNRDVNKPDPKTYLNPDYYQKHLEPFEKTGCYRIQRTDPMLPDDQYGGVLGHNSGLFVTSGEDMMKALKEADGDVSKLEKIFGMDEGDWGKNPVIIRVDDPQHLRIPDGNEMGAWTKYYIPGGFTSGNQAEAVIDSVPRGEYQVMKFNNPELMNWMKKGIGE